MFLHNFFLNVIFRAKVLWHSNCHYRFVVVSNVGIKRVDCICGKQKFWRDCVYAKARLSLFFFFFFCRWYDKLVPIYLGLAHTFSFFDTVTWASFNAVGLIKHQLFPIRSVGPSQAKKCLRKRGLRKRKASSGPLYSIHTFCRIQWFFKWTMKALILLSTYAQRDIFAWHGPFDDPYFCFYAVGLINLLFCTL